jgi:HlyD family secretion protein
MQVDANVSEADIGGVIDGKEVTFTVDAYPGEMFRGQVRQVRNVPISVQNVVTYDVVVGVKNSDLRLKPGMTANVSIIVARKDDALKLPNAALRFTLPKGGGEGRASGEGRPGSQTADHATPQGRPMGGPPSDRTLGPGTDRSRVVWRLSTAGDLEAVPVQLGISDGNSTEVVAGELNDGDPVIVGIESGTGRKADALPPGFGPGQRRTGRDRGL